MENIIPSGSTKDFTIHSVTWNTNARQPPDSMDWDAFLNIKSETKDVDLPDLYTVGFQEVSARIDRILYENLISGEDPWTKGARCSLIARDYIKLKTSKLQGIVLSVFIKRKHLGHVRNLEIQFTRMGFLSLGLKGCVSLRMNIYGVSVCFVNSHLSAHDHNLERRIYEYNTIIESHTFKQELTKQILYHDYIVWMGDLNFRLKEKTLTCNEIVEKIKNRQLEDLLKLDQLSEAREKEEAFHEFNEEKISFPPTYKFIVGTDQYHSERRPAWTDRILFKANQFNYENVQLEMSQSSYNYLSSQCFRDSSDHLPVFGSFTIKVFDIDLARARLVDDYGGLIKFVSPGGTPEAERNDRTEVSDDVDWYVGEDFVVKYTVDSGAGLYLSTWDYIALYKDDFTSLDDYVTFCWASTCRRTGLPKRVIMPDSSLWVPGSYVLLYVTASNSILGISKPFEIMNRPIDARIPIEVGEEAFVDEVQ